MDGPSGRSYSRRSNYSWRRKVIWPWGMPHKFVFDMDGQFVAFDATSAASLLEVEFVSFEDGGNYYSRATQVGRNWGLPNSLKSRYASLVPGGDVEPLTIDEYGRVSAFLKSFHSRVGSGWVSFSPSSFGVAMLESEMDQIDRVASYTLD